VLVNERRALVLAGGMLAGAVLACVLVAIPTTFAWVQTIDDWTYDLAGNLQSRPLTLIAEGFSLIGSTLVNWPLRIAALALLAWRRHWLSLTAFALAVITSELLIGVLKSAYDRPRPPDSLIETSAASFPSGHAIAGAVTAVGLVLVLLPAGRKRWQWELYAVWFALFMALSRVYLHAHWLSDVVAGALLGAGLALGWPALLLRLRAWRQARFRSHPVTTDQDAARRD
jgi:membrane-associated phospholipid phosphatase